MAVAFTVAEELPALAEFRKMLRDSGLHGALTFLNARTPHRFTGIYRFERHMLLSVALLDKRNPEVRRGEDLPLAEAYCSVLHATGEPFEMVNRSADTRMSHLARGPVASYCGVPIPGEAGQSWGALCHYDMQPCQAESSDIPLLVAAAAALRETLRVAEQEVL